MRKNESANVAESLKAIGLEVRVEKANLEFMNGHTMVTEGGPEGGKVEKKTGLLCQVTDPETKRKIIGDTFITVATRVVEELQLNPDKVLLGQVSAVTRLATGLVSLILIPVH
jgi:GMP synthase (glutamine-hydrolysing)